MRRNNIRRLSALIATILPLSLVLNASEISQGYDVRVYDQELSSNFIVSIDIDPHGDVWIGTDDGICSFDGVSFYRYNKQMGVIPGDVVNCVVTDAFEDRVWVGMRHSGIGGFNYGSGISFSFRHQKDDPDSIPSDEITDICQDSSGNIWFCGYTGGLVEYNVETQKFTRFDSSTVKNMSSGDSGLRCLAIGDDGKIYIAYYGSGFTVIDRDKMEAVNYLNDPSDERSLPSNEVGSIYKDNEGNIWVGTRRGLAIFRPVTNDFTVFNSSNSGLPDGLIKSILRTRENQLFVGFEMDGVWQNDLDQRDRETGFFRPGDLSDIDNVGVYAMSQDGYGNIWIGTYGRGLVMLSHMKPAYRKLSCPADISSSIVRSLFFDEDGSLIVGTDGAGINILNHSLSEVISDTMLLSDMNVYSVLKDRRGRLWVGFSDERVVVFDSSYKKEKTIDIRGAVSFLEHGDTVWVASRRSGLFAVDTKSLDILEHHSFDIFSSPYLSSVQRDDSGRIWVGTIRTGLYILSPDMKIVAEFNSDTGFPTNSINQIIRSSSGTMIVATEDGLISFPASEPEKWKKLQVSDSDSENIKSVIQVSDGSIWACTTRSIYAKKSILNDEAPFVIRYTLKGGDFVTGAVSSRKDGMIAFGTSSGAVYFNYKEIGEISSNIKVHFSELLIPDTHDVTSEKFSRLSLHGRDEVMLKSNQKGIRISYTMDDFALTPYVEYSYRIDAQDNRWSIPSLSNMVNFPDLSPGRYDLCVRARLFDDNWSEDYASITLVVKPPFYSSMVALISYVLLFLGTIAVIVYLIISRKYDKSSFQKVRELNEERLRFYTNITHELKTPLSLIMGPAEDLMNDKALSVVARKKAELVSKNSSRLLDLINQLLNFRKIETDQYIFSPTYGDLSDFVRGIGTIFAESWTKKDVTFSLDIKDDVMMDFDHEIVTLVVNNLLSNAIKYTEKGRITLSLEVVANGKSDDSVVISVSDTGIGIDKSEHSKIFERYYQVPKSQQANGVGIGLSVVKNLVELHHGSVVLESEKGRGSTFSFVLPYLPSVKASQAEEDGDLLDDRNKALLVVDDNEEILDYIKEVFANSFHVITARNGKDGYRKATKYVPDVIISDIMMPEMDGLELCGLIKNDIRLSHIPVLLLTAKDTNDDRSMGYKMGADSFISKPFTADMLRARVSNLLDAQRRLASRYVKSISDNEVSESSATKESFSEMDRLFLDKLTEYIEDNLSSDSLDVNGLSSWMGMSISSLYRKTKGLLGISANEYVKNIKITKAAEMLASGNFNVSEAAWNIGINSMSYFRQCFKEQYGMTPSEYKKKYESS